MPALNYTVFIDKVESGEKRQTIRATRKHPIKVGQRLHHFTGMRSAKCCRLRAGHTDFCTRAEPIVMSITKRGTFAVRVGKRRMDWLQIYAIARADGFEGVDTMRSFFVRTHGLAAGKKFHGQLIQW